jgi:hypothetical protein
MFDPNFWYLNDTTDTANEVYGPTGIATEPAEFEYDIIDPCGIGTYTGDIYIDACGIYTGSLTTNDIYLRRDFYLNRFLYDHFNSRGVPGQILISDASGVRWGNLASVAPPIQAIDVYNEGVYAGTVSRLDFYDGIDQNNLVDVIVGTAETSVASIIVSDRWSETTDKDIYRVSKVGINTVPQYDLDVFGDTKLSGLLIVDNDAELNSNLDVDGIVTFNNLTSSTSKDTGALVITNGGVGIEENLNIGNNLRVDGETILSGFTLVDNNMIITGFTTGTISTAIYAERSGISSYSDRSGISSYSDRSGISTFIKTVETTDNINYFVPFVQNSTSTESETIRVDFGIKYNPSLNSLTLDGPLIVDGTSTLSGFTLVDNNMIITGFTTGTISTAIYAERSGISSYSDRSGISSYSDRSGISSYSDVSGISSYSDRSGISSYSDRSGISSYSDRSGISTFIKTVETTNNINYYIPFVQNFTSTESETIRVDSGIKYNPGLDSFTLDGSLTVGGSSLFQQSVELKSSLIDSNGSAAIGKTDYRLASVGTGVSWRPPGVQTQNAIWVTMDGNDSNTGLLEGDAKRTIGAAAAIAQDGDTIFVRSGVYYENNPIGLRTDVTVSGQDLRLVTIVPNNPTKDVFHVRRGCLIENLNFAGSNVSVMHNGCGAVAFPPISPSDSAMSGYIAPGPASEGPSGRWRSPYVRNCTNFMSGSIGMKINGDHAIGFAPGADLKSMVCDSFTQYNEAGIGVSITNNGYAQLVSIFTINCDIGIYCDTGGSCDLTNSNSSFGNFGLVAVGLGRTEFTGKVLSDTLPELDRITLTSVFDSDNNPRKPYDGQALWFKINLDNYTGDAVGTGVITAPLQELSSITVTNGGSGFSQASPPNVIIRDADGTFQPKGPQGIVAQASANVNESGQLTSIDVISTGRNYLSTQNIVVDVEGNTGLATAVMSPIYYTVSESTEPTNPTGITTVTFNEFIPYQLFEDDEIELRRISRILTSSHSFEYIGTGTDINTSTPLRGAVPIKANEVVARDGAQIPFTSTDQKGNFDIGEGIQIDQTTSTIRGRDFSRAIQAEVTPLILALR